MRKIIYSLTIFFLSCVFHAYTQVTKIDSLKQLLATAKNDISKIDALYSLSFVYQDINFDSMLFYTRQVVLIVVKYKDSLLAGEEAGALGFLADRLWYAGNYPDAKATYFKAMEKAEPVGDPVLIAGIYNGLAIVNRNEGNFSQAIDYFSKAEALVKNIPGNPELLSSVIDKGKAFEQIGQLDSAFTYTHRALDIIYSQYKDSNVIGGGAQANMGIIYSKNGKESLAADFFRLSFQLNSEVNNQRLLARGYCEFAEHFDRNGNRDSAIYYATKGLSIDRKHNYLVQQLAASTLLTKLYTQENKIDSAFKYQRLMIETKDSVFSREKTSRSQYLEFNELLRQREMESEKTVVAEERKRNIQYILLALGIFVLISLFLLLSRRFITSSKLITFLGIVVLLIVFEFLNLLLHPFLEEVTHHSPVLMLLALVCIAALLVPLHHKLEKWTTKKLVEKNKQVRLAAAKKTIEQLEEKTEKP